MKLLEKILPSTHNIYLIGDTHEGTILKHHKGLKKTIERIAHDPIGYAVHMGDAVEGITIDDKRYCAQTTDPNSPTPVRQYKAVVTELLPIKDKLLTILEGNHDWKISGRYGSIMREILCAQLAGNKDPETLYGTYSCKLTIRDKKGRLQYKMFLTHGARSINSTADDPIRREANMLLSLKRQLFRKAGDCAISATGHNHKLLVKPPISELYLEDNGKEIKQAYTKADYTASYIPPDLRWYVSTGCFFRLYEEGVSGYAERAGYDPNELGYTVVRVEDMQIKNIERVVI